MCVCVHALMIHVTSIASIIIKLQQPLGSSTWSQPPNLHHFVVIPPSTRQLVDSINPTVNLILLNWSITQLPIVDCSLHNFFFLYKIKILLQSNLNVYMCEALSQKLKPQPLLPTSHKNLYLINTGGSVQSLGWSQDHPDLEKKLIIICKF